MGSNREKSNIAIKILEKLSFLKGKKNYFAFDGSNNIFTDCNSRYVPKDVPPTQKFLVHGVDVRLEFSDKVFMNNRWCTVLT